ncbi:MAG: hypothetical protein EON88_00690 [Brevundimonas sp.]|nr:MAG: hypothetical protein EON88_00690 [Brevundimonas sp.]
MSEPEVDERRERRVFWRLSRQRLVEMAVVVFGVLIALAFDNLAEEIRLRGDAHDLEVAFRDDILNAVRNSWERQVIAPCLTQKLSDLTAQVMTPEGAWDAAPAVSTGGLAFALPQPYRAPSRRWSTASFDRALGSEAFKRIPRERAETYAELFAQIDARRENNADEYAAVSSLAPLAFPQTGVDAAVRAGLLQNLSMVDRHRVLAFVQSEQIIEKALSMRDIADVRATILESRPNYDRLISQTRASYGDCIDAEATDRLMSAAAA